MSKNKRNKMQVSIKDIKGLVLFAVSAAVIFSACTKEIKPNLRSTASALVIEGNINNAPGPYTVLLSQSVLFYDSNNIVPVSGGHVVISDDAGNRDSLIEVSPGTYHTTFITGTPGRTYHLSVNSGGKQYDASSTMGAPVTIDTLGLVASTFGKGKSALIIVSSPSTTTYYNAVMLLGGKRQHKANPRDNELNLGILQQIPMRTDSDIAVNDTLQAELDVIDQPIYNYWYTLNNSTLSSQTAAPANPTSNISNNALGYFSAYSYTRSEIIVADTSRSPGYHSIH